MITSNTKVYIIFEERLPNSNLSVAHEGFKNLGADVELIYSQQKISTITDFGDDTLMVGNIEDVCLALKTIGIEKPKAIDYPESLKNYLSRDIWETTLGEIRRIQSPIFIKPVEHKRFSGFVWNGDQPSNRRVIDVPNDCRVYCSEIKKIRSEYRCFVLDGKILDARRYCGDWGCAPNRNFVEYLISKYEDSPKAYTADIGVLDDGTNFLVEINDGFSFGCYGLNSIDYAKMLHARWQEMIKNND